MKQIKDLAGFVLLECIIATLLFCALIGGPIMIVRSQAGVIAKVERKRRASEEFYFLRALTSRKLLTDRTEPPQVFCDAQTCSIQKTPPGEKWESEFTIWP